MQDRAEIIWSTFQRLRHDAMMSDRCSSICNSTLVSFAEAIAGPAEQYAAPDALRFLDDEALATLDRALERAATSPA